MTIWKEGMCVVVGRWVYALSASSGPSGKGGEAVVMWEDTYGRW